MISEDYFYELKTNCDIVHELLNFVETTANFSVVTFEQADIPIEIILRDKVLSYFYGLKFKMKILKMNPFMFYDWHRDSGVRGCAVNLLLNPTRCVTMFREDTYFSPRQKRMLDLNYQPNTYYLFNTSADHCVANFEGIRYSISLFPPEIKDFSKERKDYFKYKNLVKLENL